MFLNCGVGEDSWVSFGQQGNQPVNPKRNQPWIFIGRIDAEAEASILWPPDAKSQLIGKVPDAGKDWGQEEKGVTEHEMVGYHPWLNGHKFELTLGDSEGQWSLACYSLGSQRVRHNLVIITTKTGIRKRNISKKHNEDLGFLPSRGFRVASWQGWVLGLILKLYLHLKMTLNFGRIQTYSKVICSYLAPGAAVVSQPRHGSLTSGLSAV